MKLCIPAMGDQGMAAEICGHFGSAPWFILYDVEQQVVEAVANAKVDHEHGQCRPMDQLRNRGIAAVICKGMGKNAAQMIELQGIKVFTTGGATVRAAVDEFMAGGLVRLDAEKGCQGHACH